MDWDIDRGTKVYLQIADLILLAIINGQYQLGEKLPSIRDLSNKMEVNPNTILMAFKVLKSKNLLVKNSTIGYFVTTDIQKINDWKHKYIQQQISKSQIVLERIGCRAKIEIIINQ